MGVHPGHLVGPSEPEPGTYTLRSERPCRAIHGCLPYWVDPSGLRWDLITHLVCYAIIVEPDGKIVDTLGWPWTSTIATARRHGVEVLPVITMGFDDLPNHLLLSNPEARQRLIQNLRPLMTPHADGIYVDFEGNVSDSWGPYMGGFVRELREAFRQENPNFKVYVATPATDWALGWDFVDVALSGDGLFMMGYDFFGPWSWFSGPCSPLTGMESCITVNLDSQYEDLLRVRPDLLVLGVPYYANHWVTQTSFEYSSIVRPVEQLWYDDAARLASIGDRRRYDERSKTPWAVWEEDGEWHQLWYDDAASLSLKYDAAEARGLGGIGIWALGYDRQRPELWDMLRTHFVERCATGCVADVDDGTGEGRRDGGVTIDDLVYYLAGYDGGWPRADVDDGRGTGTRDGGITIDDLLYYLVHYAAGC